MVFFVGFKFTFALGFYLFLQGEASLPSPSHNRKKLVDVFFEVKADQSHPCFLNEGSIYSFRLLQLIFAYQCVFFNAKKSRQCAVDRTEVFLVSHLCS